MSQVTMNTQVQKKDNEELTLENFATQMSPVYIPKILGDFYDFIFENEMPKEETITKFLLKKEQDSICPFIRNLKPHELSKI